MANINSVKTRFGIVGFTPRLIQAIEIAIQVAPTDVPVLIQGENGTGKDVFSRIMHQFSRRKHQPFLAINTGAIPEGTMDSELFGHEKGAFTGSVGTRKGYFEEVDGGTIFLDEIGEMPMQTQQRLLRLLENKEYLRVGSSKVRHTDVRVIAATNKNLIELIRKGKFREDLYFRLNTVSIQVPALRDRGEDIPLLFQFFADEFATKYRRLALTLTQSAADLLMAYRWPGNVRELKNFVEKLTILHQEEMVTEETIREHLNVRESYLPSLVQSAGIADDKPDQAEQIQMLYKALFDLREEVAELKQMVYFGMQGRPQLPEAQEEPEGNSYVVPEPRAEISIVDQRGYTIEPRTERRASPVMDEEEELDMQHHEKRLIVKALNKNNQNRKKAARDLGISERTLYRKIKQYEIN